LTYTAIERVTQWLASDARKLAPLSRNVRE